MDAKLGEIPVIIAFAPINLMAVGGFFALTYLKNRTATEDMDYLLDPEWANDEDIKGPLRDTIKAVARMHEYMPDWANEDAGLFVTKRAREILMEKAIKQDIVLWAGKNIRVLAAPVEWVLETKLRRIYNGVRGRKSETDLSDALAILKSLRDKKAGKLDMEYFRTLNTNGFDPVPDIGTMRRVAAAYKEKYNEEAFN